MDFETPGANEFDGANLQPAGGDVPPVATRNGAEQVLVANAQGVVVLPAGVSLDDVQVEGRNLVVVADDGTRYVIIDGAIIVPQLVIDGVAVPPLNLAALLLGEQPEPAAGNPQSSGGNFASAVGPLQDAYDLGDLLPYTELQFPQPREEEILPDLVDREPTAAFVTPNNPAGAIAATANVNEAGLPARGNEPAGSNAASDSETTVGTIVYAAPDGLASVSLNGTAITAVGQTFTGSFGTLRITSIAPGAIGYSYTLADNTLTNVNDVFTVVVRETDGDVASASLTISIVDDVPTARNDADAVPAGSYAPQTGNVVTGTGTTTGAAGADTPGADGAAVTGIVAGTSTAFGAPGTVAGQYGSLVIDGQGNYTYTRGAGTPGGVTDVFTYRYTDGDGDISTATLTISIGDSPATVISVPTTGGGTVVNEAGLPSRPNETPGSDEPALSEATTGTITFAAPDGVATVQINGTTVTGPGQIINLPTGTLRIDAYNPAAGTLTYTFTLTDNTAGNNTSVTINVTVTDIDGDSDSEPFVITIIDDVPTARADIDAVGENGPVVADGNVITGTGGSDANATDGVADTPGADGATVTGVAAGSNAASAVTGNVGNAVAGTYGSLTISANGAYSYTLNANSPAVQALGNGDVVTDTFVYTITDGDGDTSTTTVTVTVTGADSPVVITGLNGQGAEVVVDEDDLSDGSSPSAAALTQAGTFSIDSQDGLASLTINGTAVFGAGVTYPVEFTTAYGKLTISGVATTTNASGEVITATVSYSYTLADNTLLHTGGNDGALTDIFTVVATDTDGSSDSETLEVTVIDDVPTANPDTNSVAEGATATGNVLTDNDDVLGADGAVVTGVVLGSSTAAAVSGNVGAQIQGTYGKLTLNADGSYTYDSDANTVPPAGATETFVYTITDGDGDTSTTTLTITLTDASFPVTDDDALVNEAGLPAGSNAASNSEVFSGSITPGGGVPGYTYALTTPATGAYGNLVLNPDGTYTYTLTKPYDTSPDANNGTNVEDNRDSFGYVVTDANGNTSNGTILVDIVDDVPTARADTDSVTEDGPLAATGNVVTGVDVAVSPDANVTDGVADARGADGATVTAVSFTPLVGAPVGGTVGSALAGTYGSLTLNADGTYRYTLDNANAVVQGLSVGQTLTETFNYTLTDGDGDPSPTTLTITINGANDPITINGLDGPGAEELVDEDDLSDGSSPNAAALTQTGSFSVTSPDGLDDLTVGTTAIVTNGVFTAGLTASSPLGTVTIVSWTPVTNAAGDVISATFNYSYTLNDNTTHPNANGENTVLDSFPVVVTDQDGSSDTASFDVTVVDDVPTARADTDSVTEDGPVAATGNVVTGVDVAVSPDANGTDGTLDTRGADGATVTAVSFTPLVGAPVGGTVGSALAGTYGSLTLNADGTYRYTLDNANAVVQGLSVGQTLTETFNYTLTDGDGDTSPTTLTITINGANDPITINGLDGPGAEELVDEDDLSDGSSPNAAALTQTGSFSVTSPDGLDDLTVGGTAIVTNGVFTAGLTASSPLGTVTIVSWTPVTNAAGDVISATFNYSYTLNDNTAHPNANGENTVLDSFPVVVTDQDGSSDTASFDVTVVDDVPTAYSNTNTVAEGAIASGNVLTDATDDVFGADGPTAPGAGVVGVRAGTDTTTPANGSLGGTGIAGSYGTLILNANGTYSYDANPNLITTGSVVDRFVYTIKDGDGDTSTTTLDITINNVTVTAADTDATVNEKGLAAGGSGENADGIPGNNSDPSETTTGTITPSGGSGTYTYTLNSPAVGSYGTLTLNPNGTYSYTLTQRYDTSPDADNGTNTEDNRDVFNYTVTDSNGNSTTGQIQVDIIDDKPTAVADTNSVTEGAIVSGNVLTDGNDDVFGADGKTVPTGGVTGVRTGTDVSTPANSNVGVQITGQYGKLTLNADGSYSYDADPNIITTGSVVDRFVYTIKDGDGDTSTTTLDITINNVTVTAADTDATVNEKGLAAGGSGENADGIPGNNSDPSETTTGTITPSGGSGTYTYTLNSPAVGSYGTLTLNPNGTYSYTLTQRYDTSPDADNGTNTEDNRDVFNYTVTDSNGNSTTGQIQVDIVDDKPTAVADTNSVTEGAIVSGNVLTDGTDDVFGADGKTVPTGGVTGVRTGTDVSTPANSNVGVQITGQYGKLTLNADGSYSYDADPNIITTGSVVDRFVYTIKDGDGDTSTTTLDITINNVTVTAANTDATVNEKGLAAGGSGENADGIPGNNSDASETTTGTITPSGGLGTYTYTLNSPAVGSYGTLTLNPNGTYSYTLTQRYDTSPDADNGTNTEDNRDVFNYTVTDSNGNSTTGQIQVDIVDDVPSINTHTDITLTGANLSGSGTFDYDIGADARTTFSSSNSDFIIDLAGTVGSAAISSQSVTWQSESATAATFNFSFQYDSDPTNASNPLSTATGTLTFNKSLNTYQFTLNEPIQSYTTSQTSQTTARVDYNLSGPASQSEYVVSQLGATNPIFVRFTGVEASSTFAPGDTTFTAGQTFQGNASYVTISGDSNGVSGDTIQGQGGEVLNVDLFTSDPGVPNQTAGYTATPNAAATGITLRMDLVGNDTDFVVILKLANPNDPTTIVTTRAIVIDPADIYKSGDTIPAGYTLTSPLDSNDGFVIIESNDYNTGLENYVIVGFQLVASTEGTSGTGVDLVRATGVAGASTGTDTFAGHDDNDVVKITDIGLIRTITSTSALSLDFGVAIIDADGDITSEVNLSINPVTPPIVLDLDGDGAEFVDTSAGLTFDYDGDGEANATAWAGDDDGLLAIDLDGNGQITAGAEIVFGGNGLTDLEGLAAKYDSNDDGVLDANDAAFAQFGVLHGGKFVSLSEAGIASIGLTTDGQGYTAANDEVIVHGTGSYTRTDGTTGSFADAAFATDRRTAEAAVTAAAASAVLVPELAAASDDKSTTDQPLERASLADNASAGAETASADTAGTSSVSSLLDAPADAADTQPTTSHLEYDRGSMHTQLQAEDVGDRSASASGGSEVAATFAHGSGTGIAVDGGEAMMAALLTVQAETPALAQNLAPVQEALAEVADAAAVDVIVDHFAGAADAPAQGEIASAVLLEALDASLFFNAANAQAPDPIEDAAQLAAAQA